jgi:hypothetical protein
LHPSDFASEIRILIETVLSTIDKPPTFEALSYTWGSTDNPIDIFIDYEDATLKVRRNLGEALPYLHYQDKARVL